MEYVAIPPNVSLEENMREAQNYAQNHSLPEIYLWFYYKVRNGGPWDYKQLDPNYQAFGNYNYGATGTAMGIPEEVLLRMAGWAQSQAGTSMPEWGKFYGYPPYGDDPEDQGYINQGIQDALNQGFNGPEIGNPYPYGFPTDWPGLRGPFSGTPGSNNPLNNSSGVDPIVIDLLGNGLNTSRINNNNFFDYNGDGFAEMTGWITSGEGLLVMDQNGDGSINNGAEIFGDQFKLPNATYALNGFQALASLDENGDGKIDSNDSAWSQLRVWVDSNVNSITENGELLTLDQLGITSLNLQTTATNTTDTSGNTQNLLGSYTKQDGTIGQWGTIYSRPIKFILLQLIYWMHQIIYNHFHTYLVTEQYMTACKLWFAIRTVH